MRAGPRGQYAGRWFAGEATRLPSAERADEVVAKVEGQAGVVVSVERSEQTEAPPLLYDLTSLQRDANRRFGFAASRTLRAAQSLYEDKKALTYPRTSSRYLPSDMIPQLEADRRDPGLDHASYVEAARYVLGLDKLPLRRVVDDAKIGDHHAIIPTRRAARVSRRSARTSSASSTWSPGGSWPSSTRRPASQRTTIVTEVQGETFRTRGRVTLEVGWRGVYGAVPDEPRQPQDADEEERGELPALEQGQAVQLRRGGEREAHDEAAAALQRGDAPLGDGDGRQVGRGRGAARGDEGARAGHAGHPRRDHRDADPPPVHRAPRQGSDAHPQGPCRSSPCWAPTR